MSLLTAFATHEASPYTIIRVGVMRTKLFTAAHYHQLIHMGLPEVIQRLQESDYAEEISAYTLSMRETNALSAMLSTNLSRTMGKLRRICDENARRVVDVYAMREDFGNLKTILRGMRAGYGRDLIAKHVHATGVLDDDAWRGLLAMSESIEQLVKEMASSPHQHIARAADVLSRELDAAGEQTTLAQEADSVDQAERPAGSARAPVPLARWEHALEIVYDTMILEFIEGFGGESVGFDEFFADEIECRNILTIFKLVREGVPGPEIGHFLSKLPAGHDTLGKGFLEKACAARSVGALFALFVKTPYASIMREAQARFAESDSLALLETLLQRKLLRHSAILLHRHPLSVDVVLGFLLAKSIEIKNLNCIIRAKTLQLDDSEAQRLLIVGGDP